MKRNELQNRLLDKAIHKEKILLRAREIRRHYKNQKNVTSMLENLAAQEGISLSTLHRWENSYEKGGLQSLIRKAAGLPKQHGIRSIDQAAIEYLKYLIKTDPEQKNTRWLQSLQAAAKQNGWRTGSRATLYRLINELTRCNEIASINKCAHNFDNHDILKRISQLEPEDQSKILSYLNYLEENNIKSKSNFPAPSAIA
jgi:hypothetical protein